MFKKIGEDINRPAVDSSRDTDEDRSIILAACEGDKKAYGRLLLKYQKRLFRFIFMMLGRVDTTEDIIQEAFVKGYMALGSFDIERPFYPWVVSIARNLALNQIKKTGREKSLSEIDDSIIDIPDGSNNPLDQMITKENDKKFARAVQALPDQYRSVFILRMFEKLSYEEIANQLNISIGTVDSRLFRAREKLVQLLKEYL